MEKEKIELVDDVINFATTLTEGDDILDFIADSIPGLKLCVRSYNSICDRIFMNKVDKFINFANNFSIDSNFEKFKSDIKENQEYKTKVSQYVLFKINKFDIDYKLKIFSNACVDFFNSNISESTLIEISENIDNLNKIDIQVIKYLHDKYGTNLTNIKSVIDELLNKIDNFKTYASISKLINQSIILEELVYTADSLENIQFKQISLSPFGKTIYKYL